MDFSVVVPLFNSSKHVEKCIRSLLDQDYPEDRYEILMIDNNSTDMTTSIVERYPRIRLLKESRQSSYAARNLGVSQAAGRIIAFTDADCEAHPQWLSRIGSSMLQGERDIVLGRRVYVSPSAGLKMLSEYESAMVSYVVESNRKKIYFGYTNNMAVRKSMFDKLGPFKVLPRGSDTLFVRNAVETRGCGIVGFLPGMIVKHLEVKSVASFYKKRMIYGKSNQSNRRFGAPRPLSQKERLRVYLDTIRARKYSFPKAFYLLILLCLGLLFYQSGRLRAE